MQPTRTHWRRRALLMLGVGLLIAIPVTLLVRDDGGAEQSGVGRSLDERFPLNPTVGDDSIDARYSVPKGWRLDRKGRAVILRSRDETVQVGITSPGPAGATDEVLDQALDSIRETYSDVEISTGSGKRVGGLKAKGAVVAASADGSDLRILVAVAKGKRRAYLVEVFSAAAAKPRRVAEAQRFLDSLHLRG